MAFDFDTRLKLVNKTAEDLRLDKPEHIQKLISMAFHLGTMKGRMIGHFEAMEGNDYKENPLYVIVKAETLRRWYDLAWLVVGQFRKDEDYMQSIRLEMKKFLDEKNGPTQ